MEKTVAIVHYNTPELTEATIRSLNKHSPGCRVVLWDNSDEAVFTAQIPNVEYIDNTGRQLVDFRRLLDRFPEKQWTSNDWGSVKHCYTVDYLWSLLPDGFLLMDSDVLVKQDISVFFTETDRYAWTGEIYVRPEIRIQRVPRLLPFLCYINVPMCRRVGIRYYDERRNWKLFPGGPDTWYDTGASFLEDCQGARLLGRKVEIVDYVEHFGGGSGRLVPPYFIKAWLKLNEKLWK